MAKHLLLVVSVYADLCATPNIIRAIKIKEEEIDGAWDGYDKCIQSFGGKSAGKRPLGRPKRG